MRIERGSMFSGLPDASDQECVEALFGGPGGRVERIVSCGQASPPGFWYEQPEDEWVCLLKGEAALEFADGETLSLQRGDWLAIPAGVRHRVAATSCPAVWLAVFLAPQVGPKAPGED